jgi:hypothetical protein
MRLMVRIPDAPPAFDGSTAFIAAVDIGDITRPMPTPSRREAGSSAPYPLSTEMWVCTYRAEAVTAAP